MKAIETSREQNTRYILNTISQQIKIDPTIGLDALQCMLTALYTHTTALA